MPVAEAMTEDLLTHANPRRVARRPRAIGTSFSGSAHVEPVSMTEYDLIPSHPIGVGRGRPGQFPGAASFSA